MLRVNILNKKQHKHVWRVHEQQIVCVCVCDFGLLKKHAFCQIDRSIMDILSPHTDSICSTIWYRHGGGGGGWGQCGAEETDCWQHNDGAIMYVSCAGTKARMTQLFLLLIWIISPAWLAEQRISVGFTPRTSTQAPPTIDIVEKWQVEQPINRAKADAYRLSVCAGNAAKLKKAPRASVGPAVPLRCSTHCTVVVPLYQLKRF